MIEESSSKSRRAFIRASGMWAVATALPGLIAGEEKDRALVCVYGMIGGSDVQVANAQGIHPALVEIRGLYSQGLAAVVDNVAAPVGIAPSADARYRALRFLPGGSFTPRWASPQDASMTTLPSGLTLASRAAADSGALAAAAATANFGTEFPDTRIGAQLRDAAALLRMRKSFGLSQPVITAVVSGFRPGQTDNNNRILGELSGALASFYRAMLELNIAKQVTAFTDMDFGARAAEARAQIVIGGSVRGGRVHAGGTGSTSYEDYTATLSRWHGTGPSAGLRQPVGFLD